MRKVFAVAMMTAMVGAIGFSQSAEAGVTYDYVFRSTDIGGNLVGVDINGNPIAGGSVRGDGLTFTFSSQAAANDACPVCGSGGAVMDVLLKTTEPLIAASVSVMWDDSTGLRVAIAEEWFGQGVTFMANGKPLRKFEPFGGVRSVDCGSGQQFDNSCGSFDGFLNAPTGPPSLPAGTYNIGTIVWDTSTISEGSNPVMTFILSGFDGTGGFDMGGNTVDLPSTEVMGFINVVPEPATAGLLGLGLAGLVLAGRRRRA